MLIDAIRGWQLSQMEKGISVLKNTVQGVSYEALTTYRDGGVGWTALEVLCHLRDFEDVFFTRARMIIAENNPALPFPNPDALAADHDYNEDNPTLVIAHWTALRKEHIEFLAACDESDWTRIGAHPTRGDFTLNDQLFLDVWHDTNHLEQILRILNERQ